MILELIEHAHGRTVLVRLKDWEEFTPEVAATALSYRPISIIVGNTKLKKSKMIEAPHSDPRKLRTQLKLLLRKHHNTSTGEFDVRTPNPFEGI